MTIEVLVATMNQADFSLLDKLNLNTDAVVINQCGIDSAQEIEYQGHRVRWINSSERGLSKSRNLAIKYAEADICVLCDDDEVLRDGLVESVQNAFMRRDVSVIGFQVHGIEKTFKKYPLRARRVGVFRSMKMSSVELAFRREDIIKNNIWFDERIGAGTEFLMGEENAILLQILRNGLKIFYEPICIADLHMGDSTWFGGWNEKYFVGRGAAFAAMSRQLSHLLIMQFAIRKHDRYKKEMSFFDAVKAMNAGRHEYLHPKSA